MKINAHLDYKNHFSTFFFIIHMFLFPCLIWMEQGKCKHIFRQHFELIGSFEGIYIEYFQLLLILK